MRPLLPRFICVVALLGGGCAADGDGHAAPTTPPAVVPTAHPDHAPADAAAPAAGAAPDRVFGLDPGWELAPAGSATLTASQTPGEVIVKANGQFPSSNYEAKLVPSPLRIWPPQYMLAWHKTGDVGAQVVTPFEVSASFKAKELVREVVVSDAGGRHTVKVDQARD